MPAALVIEKKDCWTALLNEGQRRQGYPVEREGGRKEREGGIGNGMGAKRRSSHTGGRDGQTGGLGGLHALSHRWLERILVACWSVGNDDFISLRFLFPKPKGISSSLAAH